jgi:hypothetical protein
VGLKADPDRPMLMACGLVPFAGSSLRCSSPACSPRRPPSRASRGRGEDGQRSVPQQVPPAEVPLYPPRAEFIVRSSGHRGAVGVWEHRSGDRLRVSVEPGEGEASKWRSRVGRHEYELVRCRPSERSALLRGHRLACAAPDLWRQGGRNRLEFDDVAVRISDVGKRLARAMFSPSH